MHCPPQSMGACLLVADGGRSRGGLPIIWASTQCGCLLSDAPRCILLWTLPDNMLLGSSRVGKVEFSHFMESGFLGPGASQPHFPYSFLSSGAPPPHSSSPSSRRMRSLHLWHLWGSLAISPTGSSPPGSPNTYIDFRRVGHLNAAICLFIVAIFFIMVSLPFSFFFYAPLFQTALTWPTGETVGGVYFFSSHHFPLGLE